MKIKTKIVSLLITWYKYHLLHETQVHPFIYLIWFIYSHSFLYHQTQPTQIMYYLAGVALLLICNLNIIYFFIPTLTLTHPWTSVVIVCFSLLACNQRSKFLFLILSVGQQISKCWQSNHQFQLCYCAFMSWLIVRDLPFRQLDYNFHYFVGFFALANQQLFTVIIKQIKKEDEQYSIPLLILPIVIILGCKIISNRIQKLIKMQPNNIKSNSLMIHYLTYLQQPSHTFTFATATLHPHTDNCQQIHCLCHTSNPNNATFIRQLYQQFIDSNHPNHQFIQSYINFLINQNHIIKALYLLTKWNQHTYHSLTIKLRCLIQIQTIIAHQSTSIIHTRQFQYALLYDHHYQYVSSTINHILQNKLLFWHQTCAANPRMIKLQQVGTQISLMMSQLNQFYNNTIKTYQQLLFIFDITILYAMYLYSTTNFNTYAECVLRQASNRIDKVNELQQDSCQTFGMRVTAKEMHKSFGQPKQCQSINQEDNCFDINWQYGMVIDQISEGLCKVLNRKKYQLIEGELSQIVPKLYQRAHCDVINKLLSSHSYQGNYNKIMHKQVVLPLRSNNQTLIRAYASIKAQVDLTNNLTFMCLIRVIRDKSCTAILNLNGDLIQKQDNFLQDIVQHRQIAKYFQKIRQHWQKQHIIVDQTIALSINNSIMEIKLSSPFTTMGNFHQLTNDLVPIHIDIINNQSAYMLRHESLKALLSNHKENQEILLEITSNSSTSTNILQNRTNIINQISKYCQHGKSNVFRSIISIFFIIVASCLSSAFLKMQLTNLQWDNTSPNQNPIFNMISLMRVQLMNMVAAQKIQDIRAIRDKNIIITDPNYLKQYFGVQDYETVLSKQFQTLQTKFRQSQSLKKLNLSPLILPLMMSQWSHVIEYKQNEVGFNNIIFSIYNMTYRQVVMNIAIDLNLFAKHQQVEKTFMQSTYDQQIIDIQNISYFKHNIVSSISSTEQTSIILNSIFSVIILLLIIPMIIFLSKRLPLQIKIFDLIASLDTALIKKQIKSIKAVINRLKNYDVEEERHRQMIFEEECFHTTTYKDIKQSSFNVQKVVGLAENSFGGSAYNIQTSNNIQASSKFISMKTIGGDHNLYGIFSTLGILPCNQRFPASKLSQVRKKAGELDLQGSDCQQSKLIIPQHFLIYGMIILFIIFLLGGTMKDKQYIDQLIIRIDKITHIYDRLIFNNIAFLLSKQFFRHGPDLNYHILPPTGLPKADPNSFVNPGAIFLKSVVQPIPIYEYNIQNGYQNIQINCKQVNSYLPQKTAYKFCEYDYSYRIIQGEYGSLYKILNEYRLNSLFSIGEYMANNQMYLYALADGQLYQKTLYIQSLNDQMNGKIESMIQVLLEDMIAHAEEHQFVRKRIFMVTFSWALVTMAVGLYMILKLRNQYIREVYMLSFLSSEMINNNKRMESFVESLHKNISEQ